VGFGQYWDPYTSKDGKLYIPDKPMTRLLKMEVAFSRYTTDQMQANLFFDPTITRTIQDSKDGPQFYTDGKSGLKVEQDGSWMSYTNPVAPTNSGNDMIDNVMAAISFVNQHGGWNGKHQLVKEIKSETEIAIRFQQYYNEVPIVSGSSMNFGYMQLTLQQGVVSSYNRSLLVLGREVTNKSIRQLPGGDQLRKLLNKLDLGGSSNIEAVFPAYRPVIGKETVILSPVWAARLLNGEVVILSNSGPVTIK
jgi:regulatory protein YycH of two-component signal transduction system YycFG